MKRVWIGLGVVACLSLSGCGTATTVHASSPPSSSTSDNSTTSSGSSDAGTSTSSTGTSTSASQVQSETNPNSQLMTSMQTLANQFQSIEQEFTSYRNASANGKITNAVLDQDVETLIPKMEKVANGIQGQADGAPSQLQLPLETLTNSAQDFVNAMIDIDSALQTGDESKISTANQSIQKSNNELLQFKSQWTSATGVTGN